MSNAVGTTSTVTGTLVMAPNGAISSDSRIAVDLRTLKSDQEPRDSLVRRTLDACEQPMLEFVPTRTEGLPIPLPSSPQFQAVAFKLIGNMTIRGVTKEVPFEIVAALLGGTVAGRASTTILFSDFKIPRPAVSVLLGVDDKIQLEIEFRANRSAL